MNSPKTCSGCSVTWTPTETEARRSVGRWVRGRRTIIANGRTVVVEEKGTPPSEPDAKP